MATTDPAALPPLTTWYLATNLPRPGVPHATEAPFAPAELTEMVRLYGLRNWVEQGYMHLNGSWIRSASCPASPDVGGAATFETSASAECANALPPNVGIFV